MSFPGYPGSADPGWFRTVDITPPIQEPVTIADAKAFARIEFPDDDAIVASLISQAREYVETAIARTVAPRVRAVYFQGFPWGDGSYNRMVRAGGLNPWWFPSGQGIIEVRTPPLQGVMNIQYADVSSGIMTEVNPSQMRFSTGTPGRIQPQWGTIWPLSRAELDAVQITFVAGYGLTAPFVESIGGPPSQTIMIYGQPTGGSFTLTFSGQTTTALSYSATAAQVASALAALGAIGAGNVLCSGGPLPSIPVFVSWSGSLASIYYQPPITITPSLTGDVNATAFASMPPAMPHSILTAIKQIVADSYENREASMDIRLTVTPTAERTLCAESWGNYS